MLVSFQDASTFGRDAVPLLSSALLVHSICICAYASARSNVNRYTVYA